MEIWDGVKWGEYATAKRHDSTPWRSSLPPRGMPISGLAVRPTIQVKNERAHQTLRSFVDVNKPNGVVDLRRPDRSLHQPKSEIV